MMDPNTDATPATHHGGKKVRQKLRPNDEIIEPERPEPDPKKARQFQSPGHPVRK